jgi:hypothetical protein
MTISDDKAVNMSEKDYLYWVTLIDIPMDGVYRLSILCIYVYMDVWVCIYEWVRISISMHVCMYICMYKDVCMYKYTYMYIHINRNIYKHVCPYSL